MTRGRIKPQRRLRYEFYMLALVLLVPVSLVLTFPYEAVGFAPEVRPGPAASSCAFVSLSEDQAETVFNESRAYWKVDTKGARSLHLELSEADAPEEETGSVLPFEERKRMTAELEIGYRVAPLPPTLAADEPVRLGPAPFRQDARSAAFSREELLDADEFDLKGN